MPTSAVSARSILARSPGGQARDLGQIDLELGGYSGAEGSARSGPARDTSVEQAMAHEQCLDRVGAKSSPIETGEGIHGRSQDSAGDTAKIL